ncbi:hypothetical protein EVAR_430_1 [Eumeta japonica]|uniref:Uncharacterized protein n=1 Tax=Eumeta variegata TaxID=151549 RepID=A0A4C1SA53_EUMVA|nr:hypothetical protein EVAR_430_1 [Eumeta japonica]
MGGAMPNSVVFDVHIDTCASHLHRRMSHRNTLSSLQRVGAAADFHPPKQQSDKSLLPTEAIALLVFCI